MKKLDLKNKENYYKNINDVKVFVDYTNERLKLLDYQSISVDTIIDIVNFAKEERLSKVISNCQITNLNTFRNCGFEIEGIINGYFRGVDAYCVSLFIEEDRGFSIHEKEEDDIVNECNIENKRSSSVQNNSYVMRNAEVSDIPQMIMLFENVFATYPSPVFSYDYLQEVMNEQIIFKVAVDGDKIISIASADMDKDNLNAEITDCVTYPEYRGKGILPQLIQGLEQELIQKDFYTLYSLSRAINPGINRSLSKLEYRYCGRLVNNCHICGSFEDMNIWVKKLKKD